MKVRKAIITAAGWGTRFLPVTKAQPKEMLPLVNKPVIQYSIEEALNSGIEQLIIVTSLGKHAIEDYFDRSFELEHILEQKKEFELLKEVRDISTLVNVCYIRQKEQLGLGHAVMVAREIVDHEPFALLLPDDVIDSEVPVLKQMIAVYDQHKSSVVAVQRIPLEDSSRYGIVDSEQMSSRVHLVHRLVEKPEPTEAPSNLGVVGRYILTPQIFEALEMTKPGKNREVQLTDALQILLGQQEVYAYEFEGVRYDTGTPLSWLKATLAFALKHPEFGDEVRAYMNKLLKDGEQVIDSREG